MDMTKSWIRADFLCMMMIWTSSSLGNVHPQRPGSIDCGGEFLASNAVRMSVCLVQKQPQPDIQSTFELTRKNVLLKFDPVHIRSERKFEKICEIYTLWFEPEPDNDTVVVEALITLSNASISSTTQRTMRTTLTRTTPKIPTVKMVKIKMVIDDPDGPTENEIQVSGPAYNSTVPRSIPYFSNGFDSDSFTMECVIEGKSDEIKWYKNGQEVSQDKFVTTKDPGIYWCAASTEFGTASSHHIELKVATVQPFSPSAKQIQEKTVTKGDGAKLKCDPLPYCYPDCKVEWRSHNTADFFFNEVQIDNQKTFVTEDGSLVIKKTEDTDNLYFRCDLAIYEPFYNALHGYITKLNIVNGHRSRDLTLLHRPDSVVHAKVGEQLSLYCIFAGEDTSVQWFRNSQRVANSDILQFDGITLEDSDTYTCRPTNGDGTEIYSTNVRVESKPVINGGRNINMLYAVMNRNATIVCNATGTPTPDIGISVPKIPGQTLKHKKMNGRVALEINKAHLNNTGIVYCNASNFLGYSYAATFLKVVEPVEITDMRESLSSKSSTKRYICDAKTDSSRKLQIVWKMNDKILSSDPGSGVTVTENILELTTNPGSKEYDIYTCEASDGLSSDKKDFSLSSGITAKSREQTNTATHPDFPIQYIILSGIIAFVVIVITIALVVCIVKLRSKANPYATYPRSRLSTLSDGTVSSGMANGEADPMFPTATVFENLHQDSDHLPVKDPLLRNIVSEVYIDRSRIDMSDLIGKGQFGRVYLAQLRSEKGPEGRKVAVKTLKYKADETDIVECFLKEAVIMKNFTNPHVLSLIGISFEIDGSPMVVLPYMANGDLRDFIQDPDRDITVLELLKLGLQVAKGMSYLALRKYVHRDLACRNCMVAESSTVKVADFGLSRDLFSRDYYREASGKRPLPVRWMAPECHHSNVFTTQSDVWSFGVLLWELMTRGAVPYPNIENWNVSAHVVAGNILPQPNYCPNSVYKIMLSCWHTKAESRTPFPHLVHNIEDIIHSADEGQEDCQSLYMNIQRCEEVDYRSTSTV